MELKFEEDVIVLNDPVQLSSLTKKQIKLSLKREDLLHPTLSGNKYRKLKYNLIQAKSEGCHTLLTFGGAFSNHILATAVASRIANVRNIGIIRGEELCDQWEKNPTLRSAQAQGMQFKFISREQYRLRNSPTFLHQLKDEFGDYYLLPEGGTNDLAIKGCEEILTEEDAQYTIICCPVGTGGTMSGIVNSTYDHQQVLGFPALKGNFLKKDIRKFTHKNNWKLLSDYHFGGYAKINEELINFMNDFQARTGILLDPVYTAKMLFGILDLVKKDYFEKDTRILAIHTGGLQGIAGMNIRLKSKNLPLINI